MTLKATTETLVLGETRRCNAESEFNSTSFQSSELGCHHPLCPEIRSCLVWSIHLWLGSVAGFYFQLRQRSQIPSRSQPFLLPYGKATVTPISRIVPLSFIPFWIFGVLSSRQERTLNFFSHRPCLPFQVRLLSCLQERKKHQRYTTAFPGPLEISKSWHTHISLTTCQCLCASSAFSVKHYLVTVSQRRGHALGFKKFLVQLYREKQNVNCTSTSSTAGEDWDALRLRQRTLALALIPLSSYEGRMLPTEAASWPFLLQTFENLMKWRMIRTD